MPYVQMEQRQVDQDDVGTAHLQFVSPGLIDGVPSLMGHDGSLGNAGCSAGVYDKGDIVFMDFGLDFIEWFAQVIVSAMAHGLKVDGALVRGVAQQVDLFQAGGAGLDVFQPLQVFIFGVPVDHDQVPDIGVGQSKGDFAVRVVVVDGQDRGPDFPCRQGCIDVFHPAGHQQADDIVFFYAIIQKGQGKCFGRAIQVLIGDCFAALNDGDAIRILCGVFFNKLVKQHDSSSAFRLLIKKFGDK